MSIREGIGMFYLIAKNIFALLIDIIALILQKGNLSLERETEKKVNFIPNLGF